LFDTSWEDAPNSTNQKPVLDSASVLDGWNLVTQGDSQSSATTAAGVLLDGKLIATYDPTSPQSALDWQHANVSCGSEPAGAGEQQLSDHCADERQRRGVTYKHDRFGRGIGKLAGGVDGTRSRVTA
jgi:hypothetical protein